jgi:hypothetical protein
MINHAVSINISQSFMGQAVTLILLSNPGRERLLHNPPARAIMALSPLVNSLGKWKRHMCGKNTGFNLLHNFPDHQRLI